MLPEGTLQKQADSITEDVTATHTDYMHESPTEKKINNYTQLQEVKEMTLYPASDFHHLATVLTRVGGL